jgi:hypothetical protein
LAALAELASADVDAMMQGAVLNINFKIFLERTVKRSTLSSLGVYHAISAIQTRRLVVQLRLSLDVAAGKNMIATCAACSRFLHISIG